MTGDEVEAAIAHGRRVADEEADAGADLLLAGAMGVGSSTVAAVLAAALLGDEPVAVVGRDPSLDDATWCHRVAAVRDALRRVRVAGVGTLDPTGLLAVAGGPDVAALVGFLLQAAARRTPVVLDGLVTTVAALVAAQLAPDVTGWQVAGHRSAEPAHRRALEALDLVPLVDVGARLGAGTGAALGVPLLRAAVALATELATPAELGLPTVA